MAEDMNAKSAGLQLELLDKEGKVAYQGDDGQTSVLMKGVKSIAAGDYSVVFTDGYVTSPLADVPATSASSTPASSHSDVSKSASASPVSASASANSSSSAKSAGSDAKSASSAGK